MHSLRLGTLDMTIPQPDEELSFEQAMDRLEAIVQKLDDESQGLADALKSYEEGMRLARECLARLESAEQRIEELRLILAPDSNEA